MEEEIDEKCENDILIEAEEQPKNEEKAQEVVPPALLPPKQKFRGTAYSPDMRERIVNALQSGQPITRIARILGVSRQTVHRIKKAWKANPDVIPAAKPKGGYRQSKLNRDVIQAISNFALKNPKATLKEIQRQLRKGIDGKPAVKLHISAIARALHKTGMRHQTMRHIDPAVFMRSAIAKERKEFRKHQKTNETFAAGNLLFFDESGFYLNEQAKRGWGAVNTRHSNFLQKVKGKTRMTSLFLTMGLHRTSQEGKLKAFIHYQLFPPMKEFARQPNITQEEAARFYTRGGEFMYKDRLTNRYLSLTKKNISVVLMKEILKAFCVKSSDSKELIWERFKKLCTDGPVGLQKVGIKDVGGRVKTFLGTTFDVAYYFEKGCIPEYKKSLKQYGVKSAKKALLVWDNAPTHSAVSAKNTTRISVFHELAKKRWKIGGVCFLPPRSPAFNPTESAFAYIKHYVRKYAPPGGYKQEDLEHAIEKAINKIKCKPKMIRTWIVKSCKYRMHPSEGAEEVEEKKAVEKKPAVLYADANGTLRKEGRVEEGDVDIAAKPKLPDRGVEEEDIPLRYAGYGPMPPVGVLQTDAPVLKSATIGDDMYEPEAIVAEKKDDNGNVLEYQIKWKGYKQLTWEPVNNIMEGFGYRSLLYQWKNDIRNASKCVPNEEFLRLLGGKRTYLALRQAYESHGVRLFRMTVEVGGTRFDVTEAKTPENGEEIDRLLAEKKNRKRKK